MELEDLLGTLVPAGVAVGIFGMTRALYAIVTDRGRNDAPAKFILVPLVLGIIAAPIYYLSTADVVELVVVPWWKHLAKIVMLSWAYAGSAVLGWELKKVPGRKNGETP